MNQSEMSIVLYQPIRREYYLKYLVSWGKHSVQLLIWQWSVPLINLFLPPDNNQSQIRTVLHWPIRDQNSPECLHLLRGHVHHCSSWRCLHPHGLQPIRDQYCFVSTNQRSEFTFWPTGVLCPGVIMGVAPPMLGVWPPMLGVMAPLAPEGVMLGVAEGVSSHRDLLLLADPALGVSLTILSPGCTALGVSVTLSTNQRSELYCVNQSEISMTWQLCYLPIPWLQCLSLCVVSHPTCSSWNNQSEISIVLFPPIRGEYYLVLAPGVADAWPGVSAPTLLWSGVLLKLWAGVGSQIRVTWPIRREYYLESTNQRTAFLPVRGSLSQDPFFQVSL